jgi:hypothetical protein
VLEEEYLPAWGCLMEKLEGYFNSRCGSFWEKHGKKFWNEFDKIISGCKK